MAAVACLGREALGLGRPCRTRRWEVLEVSLGMLLRRRSRRGILHQWLSLLPLEMSQGLLLLAAHLGRVFRVA